MGNGPETSRDPSQPDRGGVIAILQPHNAKTQDSHWPIQPTSNQVGMNANPGPTWSLGSRAVPGTGVHPAAPQLPPLLGHPGTFLPGLEDSVGAAAVSSFQRGPASRGGSRHQVGGAGLWPWVLPQSSILARLGVLLRGYLLCRGGMSPSGQCPPSTHGCPASPP